MSFNESYHCMGAGVIIVLTSFLCFKKALSSEELWAIATLMLISIYLLYIAAV